MRIRTRVIASSAYQEHPVRYAYTLTKKGAELGALLLALVQWGKRHIPGTRTYKESASSSRQPKAGRRAIRSKLERTR